MRVLIVVTGMFLVGCGSSEPTPDPYAEDMHRLEKLEAEQLPTEASK